MTPKFYAPPTTSIGWLDIGYTYVWCRFLVVVHLHSAPLPITATVDAFNKALHEPGPLPEPGSVALIKPLLAEPSGENDTMIEAPSLDNLACESFVTGPN